MVCECVAPVSSAEQFNQALEESDKSLLVFLFAADWAPQSSQVLDALTELSKNKTIGAIKYFKVEAESLPDISVQYGVQSIPSTLLIVKKTSAALIEGADVTVITKKIKEIAFKEFPQTVSEIPSSAKDKNDLNERMKSLINRSKVMLFIKGTRDTPRCGFTRQLLEIMKTVNAEFDTFDILSDEEIRQGLKTYSNWPTYPQIYVNGELVGGLDIIKELVELGELERTLRG